MNRKDLQKRSKGGNGIVRDMSTTKLQKHFIAWICSCGVGDMDMSVWLQLQG